MNNVFLTGRLTRDAELKTIPSGKFVLSMGFAIREDMKPETAQATFLNLVIWGDRAKSLSPYMKKGIFIAVTGRLEIRKNTKDDKTYTDVRVNISQIEFLSKKETVSGQSTATEEGGEPEQPTEKAENKEEKNREDIPF